MKTLLHRLMFAAVVALGISLLPAWPQAQNAPYSLTKTTLSSAQALGATTAVLASVTPFGQALAIAAPSATSGSFSLWIDRELEEVISVSSTTITVRRGVGGILGPHPSAAPVWWGPSGKFKNGPPPGQTCASPVEVVPWIDMGSGIKWLCRSSLWNGTINDNIAFNSDPGQTTLSP